MMVFILDPSESCGYSMDKQMDLLESILKGFEGIPIFVAESKSDLMRTDSDNIHFSAETGDGMEELKGLILKELRRILREKAAEEETA